MNNLKEFKALIERYESITLGEITVLWSCEARGVHVAYELTGFSNPEMCTLCIAVDRECKRCAWGVLTRKDCDGGLNRITYSDIAHAETPEDLLEAFKSRAKYMKGALK